MGKPAFGMDDLVPKISKLNKLQGNVNLNDLIRVSLGKFPEAELRSSFKKAVDRANARIAIDLKRALDEAMLSPIWGGRDIYESGDLMDSGSVIINKDGITVAYDSPYAMLVHYGGYINPYGNVSTRVYLPPRPWVQAVMFGDGPLPGFDFLGYYVDEFEKEFG